MSSRQVLIILHQEHSTPGRVGRLLQQAGVTLDIRRPRFGDPLPRDMSEHCGAIIFGGPMSANDPDEYITQEIDWIGVPLRDNKPFLGICLGAQMLVRHLGHKVWPHRNGRVEIGYYPIKPTPEAERLAERCGAAFPANVYHWHREGFDLQKSARLLAQGGDFPVQAFAFGACAYAVQFHPEVTYAMICRWTTRVPERLSAPGALPRERHLEGWFQHDAAVSVWLEGFLKTWLDGEAAG
jgi:GMP synthase (glutamine-hydrolysing)